MEIPYISRAKDILNGASNRVNAVICGLLAGDAVWLAYYNITNALSNGFNEPVKDGLRIGVSFGLATFMGYFAVYSWKQPNETLHNGYNPQQERNELSDRLF